jgi:prepilin-type N-terminal cleavage/methylation domain-containing protein
MNMRARRGFTLAELMVVVMIIALIASIILPFLTRSFSVQRKVMCSNNLEKIGQGYQTFMLAPVLKGKVPSPPGINSWPADLAQYIGLTAGLTAEDSVLKCPEDPKVSSETGSAMEALKEVYIEVYRGSAGDPAAWYWNVHIVDDSSQWVWRLSQEQWNEVAARSNHGQGFAYPGYKEGADPTKWWFTFEDQGPAGGGDKDYWDEMVRVEVTDNEVVLYPHSGIAGYNFSLAMGEGKDRVVLIPDMKLANEKPTKLPGTVGKSSYGINSVNNTILRGANKLLIVDYEKTIAKGSTYDKPDSWLSDEDVFPTKTVGGKPIPAFFRHFDKANVLMGTGAVRSLGYSEIDISSESARKLYWNPDK